MTTGNNPEKFDYPMSHWYREGVSSNKRPPKPTVQPRGRVIGKQKIAGITLNVTEGAPDQGSFPAIEENLVRMGIYPKKETKLASEQAHATPTPQQEVTAHASSEKKPKKKAEKVPGRIKGQSDFFDKVPEFQFKTPPRDPDVVAANDEAHLGRIHQRAQGTDERDRRKIVQPDVGHDQTVANLKWRQANGLPERARSWKELQVEFEGLSEADRALLKDMGFRPDLVRNPHSKYVERMLDRLRKNRTTVAAKPPVSRP